MNGKIIKFVSYLLCISFVVSALTIPFIFKTTVNAEDSSSISEIKVSENDEYSAYLKNNSNYIETDENFSFGTSSLSIEKTESVKVENKIAKLWDGNTESAVWSVNVPNTAFYCMKLDFLAAKGAGMDYNFSILIDGKLLFSELDNITFKRIWQDSSEIRTNSAGNQISPSLKEVFDWQSEYVIDGIGFVGSPLKIVLTAGKHKITFLRNNEEPIYLSSLSLCSDVKVASYYDVLKEYEQNGYKSYSGEAIKIEGEKAYIKSSDSLIAKSDTSCASVKPSSPAYDVINYIGSSNWAVAGDYITWKVNVKQDGLYSLGFRFRQNYLLGNNVYRMLEIDGKVPFEEAKSIDFIYNDNWQYGIFSDNQNKPYLFHLTQGEHILKLTVTLGNSAAVCSELQDCIYRMGNIYHNMVMVMGTTPDTNRNYDLFKQIKGIEDEFKTCYESLISMNKQLKSLTGNDSDSVSITMQNAASVIKRILDNPYRTQHYKNDFYSNYCGLGSALTEIQKVPLDIDQILLLNPDDNEKKMAGWKEQFIYSIKRFIASFTMDYNNISGTVSQGKNIDLWVSWGRDQVQVLNNAIQELFTPKSKIGVNVKIVDASLIQAILSGSAPDCYLRLARTSPVDLAMRGALYDLKNFDDFDEVLTRFAPGAEIPYNFKGGCYALPDTQSFNMMFYRKDIFEKYNLQVPKTWEEFINVSTFLFHKNLQVGVPYTKISDLGTTSAGIGALNLYPTLLLQNGLALYNDEHTATNLSDKAAIAIFEKWTDFYAKYSYSISYDFYNRFRSGEMPMGIAPYTQYNTIAVAATEISGLWGMVEIPGTKQEDGSINYMSAGGGSGSAILNVSKKKDLAWEFLKWWTSAEAQTRYAKDIEAVLGAAARVDTANVDALKQLSWDKDDLKSILNQWSSVVELPEIPGSYYTIRSIDQAFWAVVNSGENPTNTLIKWSKEADDEIMRKRHEYRLDKSDK